MIPKDIFKIGDMLGLDYRYIQNLLSDKKEMNKSNITTRSFSPMNSYKGFGSLYGTISINDF